MNPLRFGAAFAALALSAALAGRAPAADDKPIKGDLATFQGSWTVKVGPEKNIEVDSTIKGNKISLKVVLPDGQEFSIDGEIQLDDAAKPHKTIDWVKFVSPNGDEIGDNHGIYEIVDKDTIKVCNGGPGNDRPTEFTDGDGGRQVTTMKRKAAAAPAEDAKPEALKGDAAAIQGAWTAKVGPDDDIPMKVVIKGKAVELEIIPPNADAITLKGEVKLDETAKPHKTIDWVNFKTAQGDDAPPNLGIYRLEGDTLTVCSGGPGGERPSEFKAGEDGPPRMLTLKRDPAK